MNETAQNIPAIAVVGMAGRFPGAGSLEQFWRNLRDGVESISHFRVDELQSRDEGTLAQRSEYVAARSILDNVEMFDAEFFGISPHEAAIMDPQHRIFLECCHEALEHGGCDPERFKGSIGVFAGCSLNTYLLSNLAVDRKFIDEFAGTYQVGSYQTLLGNDKDFLPTRVSYKLNLRGPSFAIQCACSTSLVAICQACQNLLIYGCDMALAGGVSITFPQKRGHESMEGGMASTDGHCRPFEENAKGTVFGHGSAVVLLKRLEDALEQGDTIHGIIRGFAVNNDGSAKPGYAAPSIEGQVEVISAAHAMAGVPVETISYVEAHGTGTPLGDPIEVAALTKAFRSSTEKRNFCALGTAKGNIGHLDIAAGVTGLIKTLLSMKHHHLPPLLHFKKPNPRIDFDSSPFYVNNQLRAWKSDSPLRAGVSAFGLGGTNAHVVIEEGPQTEVSVSRRKAQLLLLSAKKASSADAAVQNLAEYFKANPGIELADASYTLQVGRRSYEHRRFAICSDADDAVQVLQTQPRDRFHAGVKQDTHPGVVFLFAGQGVQRINMGRYLYESEVHFRQEVLRCAEILKAKSVFGLCETLYPSGSVDDALLRMNEPLLGPCALFAVEYALGKLWMHWGIEPCAMIGHSLGELVAACLASVISLDDALTLIVERARLLEKTPPGSMLSVLLGEDELKRRLSPQLSIASVNSPSICAISGSWDAIEGAKQRFDVEGVTCQLLQSSYAYHSPMMDSIIAPLTASVQRMQLRAPSVPIVSTVTGEWMTPAIATSPSYWASQVRAPVRFSDALRHIKADQVLLEASPGSTLAVLAKQCCGPEQKVVYTVPDYAVISDEMQVLSALGQMWLAGAQPDWKNFYGDERRASIPLPTYAYERRKYWIEPPEAKHASVSQTEVPIDDKAFLEQETMAAPIPVAPARKSRICKQVVGIIEDASGTALTESQFGTHFLELGFDSLLLTQVAIELKKTFKLSITFRQLQDEESTLEALATFIDSKLPPEEPPKAPAPARTAAAPATSRTAAATALPTLPAMPAYAGNGSGSEQSTNVANVVREQLQTMSALFARQLEMLQRFPGEGAGESVSAPPPVSSLAPAETQKALAQKESVVESKTSTLRAATRPTQAPGLTAKQELFVKALVERYARRTPGSKRMTQAHRRAFADPRIAAGFRPQWKEMVYPLVTDRSRGSRIWDVDGNEYIDILGGFGPIMLGHSPSYVTEAVEAQIKLGIETGPSTPLAGEVAELISELTGVERTSFCNSGSEAVMAALRLSRTVTGRDKVVIFAGSYHGMFEEVLVKLGRKDGVQRTVPSTPGIPYESVDNMIVLEYGSPEALAAIEKHANELAAVLVEPVQSRHANLQPKMFLERVREITARAGAALIFDEVVTGFRIHPGGAQAYFGIKADLVTYGKVLGGGYAIGAIAGKAQFMDALDGGYWEYGDDSFPGVGPTFFAGTFFRHPVSLAAAKAVLLHMKSAGPELQKTLTAKTARLVARLRELFESEGVPTTIEHFASWFYFGFSAIEHPFGSLLYYLMRERGVHIQEGFPCFMNTAHSDADLEYVFNAFKESVAEMRAAGFFGGAVEGTAQHVSQPSRLVLTPAADRPVAGRPVERETAALSTIATNGTEAAATAAARVQFSLYYFGNYDAQFKDDKYRLLFEGVKFGDRNGYTAAWIPERHFHSFGGFSPNPSVLAAALARETQRIQLRAGSVVVPLHHPIRVAEEWSVVDNLSKGRVGISIASGWHPNDFVLAPEAYAQRKELCHSGIETIRKLWRGEAVKGKTGTGSDLEVKVWPMPMQPELPLWLTCIHPESFVKAGELGTGVLCHTINQSLEDIKSKIALYRESLAKHGRDPNSGHVTILLHTFLDDDVTAARDTARKPFCDYLESFVDKGMKKIKSEGDDVGVDREDLDFLLSKAYADYVKDRALVGSPDSCAKVVEAMIEIGVDEIGCFIDFGVASDKVLASLNKVNTLKRRFAGTPLAVQSASAPAALRGYPTNELVPHSAPSSPAIPLTEEQLEVWLSARLSPEASCAYNESISVQFDGELNGAALQKAFDEVIARHDALRTVFEADGEIQRFVPGLRIELPFEDWSSLDAAARAERLAKEKYSDARLPFDLIKGPLVRAKVIRLQPKEHLLLYTAHHIVCDGWSANVLLGELAQLYTAYCHGESCQLPAPMSFGAYAQAQREHHNAASGAEMEEFWVKQFTPVPPLVDLPTDRLRPMMRSYAGDTCKKSISPEVYQALKRACARQHCTLFALLLAGFQILVNRLSGQEEIVVGIPTAGQSLLDDVVLVGHCVNFLPIRSSLAGNPTIAQFVAQVKKALLDMSEHQNYTYGRLVRKLSIQRDPSRLPLTELQFNLERVGGDEQFANLGVSVETNAKGAVNSDIFCNVIDFGKKLDIDCDFNTDLYDRTTVERWLGHYATILEGLASTSEGQVNSLPVLSSPELEQMLVKWNDTRTQYQADKTLDRLFEEQALRTPESVAVVFAETQLTYRDVDRRANRIAARLRALGVQSGVLVGLSVERSADLVPALLGILKAGGAYIPMDFNYPRERLEFMIQDTQVPVIVTQNKGQRAMSPYKLSVLNLDEMPNSDEPPAPPAGPQSTSSDVAYVMFTSGSTGKPKGVQVSHRSVVNFLASMRNCPGLTASDVLFSVTTLSFDIAGLELFLPLTTGARVVLPHQAILMDGAKLSEEMTRSGTTVMQATPATWRLMIEGGWNGSSNLKILCGGEALTQDLARQLLPRCASLWNMYGPTETTIWSAVERITNADESIKIGRPIANTQFHILNSQFSPVPVGAHGELFIGGDGLAKGYLNRPDLTAERFVRNPFSSDPASRLYRTGDLARYHRDGRVECLGRTDFQVKIRGFRIELGEIESVIVQHPDVGECVVVAREDLPGKKSLVAYATPKNVAMTKAQRDSIVTELRAQAQEKLPFYMVPSVFMILEKLPLSTNGKVDRKALPVPGASDLVTKKEFTAPRTAEESKLAEIWANVLRLERVGIHDDIFELGGDSLLIYRITTRATQAGFSLTPIQVFQHRTVAELASNIAKVETASSLPQIKPLSRALHRRTVATP